MEGTKLSKQENHSKPNYLLLFCIATWVIVLNIIIIMLQIPGGWTLFFANIFFFEMGADVKKLKTIFWGGSTGLACAWILAMTEGVLGPVIGGLPALFIVLALIIYIIIVLGPIVPSCFNNVAFAFLTISTINMQQVASGTLSYLIVFIIGGVIMIGGCILILKLFEKVAEKGAEAENKI